MNKKSLFIVLEGLDCSGKTSLLDALKKDTFKHPDIVEYFNNNIIFTFEPGSSHVDTAQRIRQFLFSEKGNLSPFTEALFFLSSRSEHVSKCIRPALEKQGLVICDRFFLSTLTYQGFFSNIDPEFLYMVNKKACHNIVPDIVVFLDISKEKYEERYAKKEINKEINSYDLSHKEYKEVNDAYCKSVDFLRQKKENITIINGNKNSIENSSVLIQIIRDFIGS